MDEIKPRPYDLGNVSLSGADAPKELKGMTNLKGVQNTVIVIKTLVSIGNKVFEVTAEDSASGKKITIAEGLSFIPKLMEVPEFISAIGELPAEFLDEITPEELDAISTELVSLTIFVTNEEAKLATIDLLKIIVAIKAWLQTYIFKG